MKVAMLTLEVGLVDKFVEVAAVGYVDVKIPQKGYHFITNYN
jgi:hypothetical protein